MLERDRGARNPAMVITCIVGIIHAKTQSAELSKKKKIGKKRRQANVNPLYRRV